MRFLVDESVSRAVTRYLRSIAYDTLAVVELAPQAADQDILAWAANEKRIVITSDKDFGELVFRSNQGHAGVILLRLRDDYAATQVSTIARLLTHHASDLPAQFVVATERGHRTHRIEA